MNKFRSAICFSVVLGSLTFGMCSFDENGAFAQEKTQVEKNCEASEPCSKLGNETPDYNLLEGKIVEVIDADTIKLELFYWPQHSITTSIRLKGVDTPELEKAKCLKEKLLAEEVAGSIRDKYPVGTWVIVSDVEFDKYAGRYVAEVKRWRSDRLISASAELLANERWAAPYTGQGQKRDWCAEGQ